MWTAKGIAASVWVGGEAMRDWAGMREAGHSVRPEVGSGCGGGGRKDQRLRSLGRRDMLGNEETLLRVSVGERRPQRVYQR